MRYKLKDYQSEAAQEILNDLRDARADFHERNRLVSFALSATTGSGKTVIASAVIEALFRGSDEFDYEADPSAVVLWVTDDPSLNEQTRSRIKESADRLEESDLVTIDEGFKQEKFDSGILYFLNVQKLGVKTTYVKHSDDRRYTLWETIQATIEDDSRTLYLVLDEAHRGMRAPTKSTGDARSTIVQRLVNGHDGVPPVPIVWGISATIDRFHQAMKDAHAHGRTMYAAVEIDPRDVQSSGLLKDTIVLEIPNEKGNFETTLLRKAVSKFVQADELWAQYLAQQGVADAMRPLLVVQVPNKASDALLARYVDVIRTEWKEFQEDSVANVFGEHKNLDLGKYKAPYIQPQDVQEADDVRILLAKDAVSTGWDCPRAEVLFSMRSAVDKTHITQLLGRMVRTPLARRVETDERLNAVSCFLPAFDKANATEVADRLTGKRPADSMSESVVPGRKVVFSPVELAWNSEVPDAVKDFLAGLPSESKPNPKAKPIKRLLALAAALSLDELMDQANTTAMEKLYGVLDGQMAQHATAVSHGVKEIRTADLMRLKASMSDQTTKESEYSTEADDLTVDDAYRLATRLLGAALANGYARHLAENSPKYDGELNIYEAKAKSAAVMRIEGAFAAVEAQAKNLTKSWLAKYYVQIEHLSDERRAAYNEIRGQASEPERQPTIIPDTIIEESKKADGELIPTKRLHVLSTSDGDYPIGSLGKSGWETKVLDQELARPHVIGWYRNPSHSTTDAIRIPYRSGNEWKSMQPDFIFVSQKSDKTLTASIVDPHGPQYQDALPKLNGLANFAEKYEDQYVRIQALAENRKKQLVFLDMNNKEVREAVRAASAPGDLYNGSLAQEYL